MTTRDAEATRSITYRELLLRPDHLAFVVPGFIGRLPLAMRALGCILLIQGVTGEYGLAGLVGASQTLVSAFASPRIGRLADRRGTRPVLIATIIVQTLAVTALIAAAYADAPAAVLMLAAAAIGGSAVPYGSFSRARWSLHVARGRDLDRAYALEGAIEEVSFIVGPALVVLLAVDVTPSLGLVAALALAAIASAGFIRLPDSRRHAGAAHDGPHTSLLRNPVILIVAGSGIGMGVVFGATEISLVAFAEELGREGAASVLIGLFAAGSLVAAVLYGLVPPRQPLRWRAIVAVTWVGLWMIPVALVGSLPAMIACIVGAGLGIAPWAIASSSLIERGVPARALIEGFGWFSASVSTGAALGAMAGGIAIDTWGANGGQAVAILGGALAIAITALGQGRLARVEAADPT